jgi:TolA-binding protein
MFKLILNQQVFVYYLVLFPLIIAAQDQSAESDILFLKIQELEMEMADLRNEVEAQNYLIDKLIRESVEEENENSNQIDNIDTNIVDDVYRFDGINDSKSIEEIYDEAIRSLANEEYESAKKLFSYLIDNFSDPEKLPLSLFWLGEIEFSSSNFDQSKIHYIELISSYENHWRVPLAHKKIGDIFFKKGDIKMAKEKYQYVIREFPNNPASSMSLQSIEDME